MRPREGPSLRPHEDSEGRERLAPVGRLFVPEVELHGDWLVWPAPSGGRSKSPRATMITDFARLRDPAAILRFAKHWGPLGLCEHDLPWPHDGPPGRCWVRTRDGAWLEPVRVWQRMASQVDAMLRVSISLHDGRAGAPADWDALGLGAEQIGLGPGRARDEKTRLAQHWDALLVRVDEWLVEAVRPLLIQRRGRPTFVLDSWWLHGALGLQLALAVCGAPSFLVCDGCGEFFEVKRRRRYCEECGVRAAWRRASEKLYAAKQKARQLAQEGRSVAEIGTMLSRRPSQVTQWIRASGKSDRRTGRRGARHTAPRG
jgi:hypothetical protein